MANGVTTPPVWANGALVFGTSGGATNWSNENNALYFLNAEECKFIETDGVGNNKNFLHTGPLYGPMVSLGGRGEVVGGVGKVSGANPPRGQNSRLILVDAHNAKFAYTNPDMDCATPGVTPEFKTGVSLMSWGETWRVGAVGNNGTNTLLYAFNPHETTILSTKRCIPSSSPLPNDAALAPVWGRGGGSGGSGGSGVGGTVVLVGPSATPPPPKREWTAWEFAESASAWTEAAESTAAPPNFGLQREINALAIGPSDSIWASGHGESGGTNAPGLERVEWKPAFAKDKIGNKRPHGPVAIDETGRAYVVVDFFVHRYEADGSGYISGSTTLDGDPVGSPILGQPAEGEDAEIYVVTKLGTVYAFDFATFNLLWELPTGITISPAAQPLLVDNTLWFVGTQGQVRAIRVNSNGLNKKALWPKHLRDNCNTGNASSNPDELPECF
jgi:hypothetical protein